MDRKHDRFATCFDSVLVSFSGGVQGVGTLYDISYGGCKVASPITPTLGAAVTLRLRSDHVRKKLIIGSGTVAWIEPTKYFGVKFLELRPHEERALNRYLSVLNNMFLGVPHEYSS